MLVLLIDDVYELRANSWCLPERDETFPTLSEAKRQCSDDPSCTMFYDFGGRGNKFCLCDEGAQIATSSTGSLLHIKRSEYLCICTSFCHASNQNMVKLFVIMYI